MTFPNVVARNSGNSGANTTTPTINLPDGSDVVGRLVYFILGTDGNPGISVAPSPGTWTQHFAIVNGTVCKLFGYWRVIDGTEGFTGTGDTVSLTLSASEGSAHQSWLIEGHDSSTNAPERVVGGATGSSANPDPPSLTPAAGAKDYLWIAVAANDGNVAITAAPANFTTAFQNDRWANTNGVGVARGERQLNTTVQDPGTFTMATEQWIAQTIAIHPGTEGLNQTLTATPAVIKYVGVAPTISPGDPAPSVTPAIVKYVGVNASLSASGGGDTLTVTPAVIRFVGIAPSVTPGDPALTVTPAIIRYVGVPPSRTATVTRAATPAIIRYVGIPPGITPGAVSRSATPGIVRWVGVAPSISAGSSPSNLTVTPAVIRWVAVAPSRSATVSIAPTPGIVRWVGVAPTRVANVARNVTPAIIRYVAIAPTRTTTVTRNVTPAIIRWIGVAPTRVANVTRNVTPAIIRWVGVDPLLTGGGTIIIPPTRRTRLQLLYTGTDIALVNSGRTLADVAQPRGTTAEVP